ncbi:Transcription factor IIIB 90 kDa subunit [Gracilariopsis chorda]|uniref:B-related factor 1 n=1 Tax=Gracilariopsis chorda TaxID=448386 RepID=A0A2V3IX92_9FLOR|nr:Transcription factor IIIB 90 kDa subunit [Gracilariopsis chorda]|eukprot:PXF46731.1 Transcription factor IIIB 90 kDa subunit [Gracilariopsis chorda]
MSAETQKCSACGSYEIDFDAARGQASCMSCGEVLEQNAIVAEVGFVEDARGRSNMVGQHVRADGRSNFASMPGYSARATFTTMLNARHKLRQLVSALKLHQRHTEAAERLFRLAAERNFHRGRRLANVCCACLYAVCRIEKTPHMLLDFADVLETNVYLLGHTFLKFSQVVALNLPVIDPSLYIHRFASKLEFGDKTNAVAMTALRILARMQRDWLSHGRRPSSLCGAALMCAAGMHQFHRSMVDVCRVVRIGNVTLRERLQELNKTPTAGMTAAEIVARGGDDGKISSLNVDGEPIACDPPAFQRSQRLKDLKRKFVEGSGKDGSDVRAEKRQRTGSGFPSAQRQLVQGEGDNTTDVAIQQQMQSVLASVEMQELERESREEEQLDAQVASQAVEKESNTSRETTVEKGEDIDGGKEYQEDLSDLEEEDVNRYFNTEEEYRRKEVLWTEINKDYLEKQERLERMRRERPEDFKRLRPTRKTPKKKNSSSDKAAKAGSKEKKNVPQEPAPPKPSKKLNYAKLKQLAMAAGQQTTTV